MDRGFDGYGQLLGRGRQAPGDSPRRRSSSASASPRASSTSTAPRPRAAGRDHRAAARRQLGVGRGVPGPARPGHDRGRRGPRAARRSSTGSRPSARRSASRSRRSTSTPARRCSRRSRAAASSGCCATATSRATASRSSSSARRVTMPGGPGDAGAAHGGDAGGGGVLLGSRPRPPRGRHPAHRRDAPGPPARGRDARHPGAGPRARGPHPPRARAVARARKTASGGRDPRRARLALRPRRPRRRPGAGARDEPRAVRGAATTCSSSPPTPRTTPPTTPRRASRASASLWSMPANGVARAADAVARARRAAAAPRRRGLRARRRALPRALRAAARAGARCARTPRRRSRPSTAAAAGPAISLTRPLLRRLARHVDAAAAVSAAAATTLREGCGSTPRCSSTASRPSASCEFDRERRRRTSTVVFVGRHEERKGVALRHRRGSRAQRDARPRPGDSSSWATGRSDRALEALAAGDASDRASSARADDEGKRRWLRRADVVVAPVDRAARASGWSSLEGDGQRDAGRRERHRRVPRGGRGLRDAGRARRRRAPSKPGSSAPWRTRRPRAIAAARRTREEWSMTRLDGPLRGALRARRRAILAPDGSLDQWPPSRRSRQRRAPVARPQPALRRAGPRPDVAEPVRADDRRAPRATTRAVRDFALAPPPARDDRRGRRGRRADRGASPSSSGCPPWASAVALLYVWDLRRALVARRPPGPHPRRDAARGGSPRAGPRRTAYA